MLCQVCDGIFQGELRDETWRPHHKALKDLYQAANNKCWICEELWKNIVEQLKDDALEIPRDGKDQKCLIDQLATGEISWVLIETRLQKLFNTTAYELYFLNLLDTRSEYIFLWNKINHGGNSIAFGAQLSSQVGDHYKRGRLYGLFSQFFYFIQESGLIIDPEDSQYPIELAKHWIQRCLKTHLKCKSSPSGWLPSRLLYITNSSPVRARLIQTNDCSMVGPYVTLSHCWGIAEFFKHTSQTSTELYSGINVSILPQTFQDAIHIAIQLGIDYIWIDSLCIIQDDHNDWLCESSTMGQVYQNGYCNIAATKSSAAAIGFAEQTWPRTKALRPPCYLQSNWTACHNARIHLNNWSSARNTHLSGPLLQRGWVVQERVMAPRTIHFGSNQLFWECSEHEACEAFPNGNIPRDWQTPLNKPSHPPLSLCNNLQDTVNFWNGVVETFSLCQLTIPSDKLVALSGIAKAIQAQFRDMEYLAGVWRWKLERQLLWCLEAGPGVRPLAYRVPSWSWASLDGTVSYSQVTTGDLPCLEILDAVIKPLGSDPTGQVESGFLRVLGAIMTLSIEGPLNTNRDVALLINGRHVLAHRFFPDIKGDPADHLHCLPVFNEADFRSWSYSIMKCLVLRPTGVGKGKFIRYGVCELYARGAWIWFLDGVPQWKDIKNEEWLEFEEDHGDGRYTITII